MRRLPLSLFEQYLFYEDRPGYPSRTTGEFRFAGTVDREAFERAVAVAAKLHPLATAQVTKGRFGRLYWRFANVPRIPVYWHDEDRSVFRPRLRALDISRETGWEMHVTVDASGWTLLTQQSHVICDGAGALKLVHDALRAYEGQLTAADVSTGELVARLARRTRFGLTLGRRLRLVPMQIAGIAYAIGLSRRRIAALIPSAVDRRFEPLVEGSPHVVSRILDGDSFTRYRQGARTEGVSINDLCIARLQTAVGRFREELGVGESTDWIRISVPVNLRSKSDANLSACNVISLVPIDRAAKGLLKRERLLRRAKEDMDLVKRDWLGLVFLKLLGLHRLLPGGIRRMSHKDICRSTLVLSNVGHLMTHSPLIGKDRKLHVKGATLESIRSTAPIRPHLQASLLVSIYAGTLQLDLHYDARALTESQAERLLELLLEEIDSR